MPRRAALNVVVGHVTTGTHAQVVVYQTHAYYAQRILLGGALSLEVAHGAAQQHAAGVYFHLGGVGAHARVDLSPQFLISRIPFRNG